MEHVWQFQQAKNRLGEVVGNAIKHGPQVITKRGKQTAVILSYETYRELVSCQKPLSVFFRDSPLTGLELDLSRSKSPPRDDIDL